MRLVRRSCPRCGSPDGSGGLYAFAGGWRGNLAADMEAEYVDRSLLRPITTDCCGPNNRGACSPGTVPVGSMPMMRSTVRSVGRFLPVQASMRLLSPTWSTVVNTSSWVRVGTASWTSSAETISSPLPLNDLSDGRRAYDPQKLHLTRKVGSVIPDTYRLSQPPKRGRQTIVEAVKRGADIARRLSVLASFTANVEASG